VTDVREKISSGIRERRSNIRISIAGKTDRRLCIRPVNRRKKGNKGKKTIWRYLKAYRKQTQEVANRSERKTGGGKVQLFLIWGKRSSGKTKKNKRGEAQSKS